MAEPLSSYPQLIYDAQSRGYQLPKRLDVELWSTFGANDGNDLGLATAFPLQDTTGLDPTLTHARETHVGEDNGGAQRRLIPRRGKYSSFKGLNWMKDITANTTSWSHNPGDEDYQANGSGIADYITGGPFDRMYQVHVIDCAGYDYLTLHWQCHVLSYEGLRIVAETVSNPTFIEFYDAMRLMAAGMPSIDSREVAFSLPKMFMMNDVDSLATTGDYNDPRQLTGLSVAASNLFDCGSRLHGVLQDDIVMFSTVPTATVAMGIGNVYYVLAAGLTSTAFTASTSSGGAAIDLTVDNEPFAVSQAIRLFTANAGTDTLTFTQPHGKANGDPVVLWNSGGALPTASPTLTGGEVVFARDVTTLTMKLARYKGGPAIDLTGAGAGLNGIDVSTRSPGHGRRSRIWTAGEKYIDQADSVNWNPQNWIQGGVPLWGQWRPSTYPGTDRWYDYDNPRPMLSFSTPLTGAEKGYASLQALSGPPFLQFGKIWKNSNTIQCKWVGPGDVIEANIKLGYPVLRQVSNNTANVTLSPNVATTGVPTHDLQITGLARIAMIIGGIGLSWAGAGSGNNLAHSVVAPAIAPRQHIRGKLTAILSRRG